MVEAEPGAGRTRRRTPGCSDEGDHKSAARCANDQPGSGSGQETTVRPQTPQGKRQTATIASPPLRCFSTTVRLLLLLLLVGVPMEEQGRNCSAMVWQDRDVSISTVVIRQRNMNLVVVAVE